MSAPSGVAVQSSTVTPPYPAAVSMTGGLWRSPMARDGRVALAKPAIQIGRMDGNDISLTDPLVSRYHAAIRWAPNGYEIEDLGSANGTYVQGQRVQGRMLLAPGQTIRIGNTELHFNHLNPAQQAPAGSVAPLTPGSPSNPGAVAATMIAQQPLPAQGAAPMRPAPPMSMPMATPQGAAQHPYYAMMPRRESALAHFFKTQGRKRYWRVFLLGLLAYIVVGQVLSSTENPHLVPLAILLASSLVPVVFVIFCWEQSAFADMPPAVVGLTFLSGAILGLVIAAVVENALIQPSSTGGIDLGTAIIIGVCEETAKVIAVVWFLRDKRLRSELDGLILGAAAGMGFAALETAGYGFASFLTGFIVTAQSGGSSLGVLFNGGLSVMNHALLMRMALAIFGHGVWTAIVCAVIWRERGQSTFRVTPSVIIAFFIAVGLHALWDWSPLASSITENTDQTTALVITFGWFLLVGIAGLLILRFLLRESLERAKLGPMAPPPPPLLQALFASFGRRPQQPAWQSYAWPANVSAVPPTPGMAVLPSMPPQPQPVPPPMQAPPAWPVAQGPNAALGKPAYCPRCALSYPPGTQVCPRCNGRLS